MILIGTFFYMDLYTVPEHQGEDSDGGMSLHFLAAYISQLNGDIVAIRLVIDQGE